MREFNALGAYPQPKERVVGPDVRTIKNKIIASYRDEKYYDGERNNGYGGFKYDGRWATIMPTIIERYGLKNDSTVLDLGCKKGFFMHDLKQAIPGIKVRGIENHPYPIEHAMESVKDDMIL